MYPVQSISIQTVAKIQAMETTKLTLAGTISTDIAALIENSMTNEQLTREEAATVTKTSKEAKSKSGTLIPGLWFFLPNINYRFP